MNAATVNVLAEVLDERQRQDAKWGEQNHNNGTGGYLRQRIAEAHRRYCDQAFASGTGSWREILQEEVSEAFAEEDTAQLRTELMQVAAVAVGWIEAIDRRRKDTTK